MKSTLRTIVGFAFCPLLALPAGAAEQKQVNKPVRQQVFERLDKNRDAKLDVNEFLDGSVGRAAGNKQEEFGQLDGDGDGFLSFNEYRESGKSARPDPTPEMNKLDADADGNLTLEEYLADKSARIACRRTFLRHDVNEDGLVTLDELKRWVESSKLSQAVHFKMRDDNQDDKLTVNEFNLWRDDPGKILAGQADFARHDADRDGFLTFLEFQFTSAGGGPSQDALFERLDTDGDSRLTPDELTSSMSSGEAAWARSTLAEFDTDNDGALDLAEFTARREELDRRHDARTAPRKWPWWQKLLAAAGSLVVLGVILVLVIPWLWLRRPRRLRRAAIRMELLKRRLRVAIDAARRRWRWGVGLLVVAAVAFSSPWLWQTLAQRLAAISPPSTLAFPEPTEFEARGRTLKFNVSGIRSVAFSDNSRLLAVAHGDYLRPGAVRVWFLNKKKVWSSWEEPTGVYSVHISPNGRLVASQSFAGNRRVKIRSVESGGDVLEIDVGNQWAWLHFSPDGKTLATASTGGELKLWNVDNGMEFKSLASLSFSLWSVAFSRDGKRIAATGGSYEQTRESESSTPESPVSEDFGWAGVWDVASGAQIAEINDPPSMFVGIAVSPSGKLIATTGRDDVARLWEAETGKLIAELTGHGASLACVDFSPDGKTLATGSYDHTARLWSVDSGQEVATLPEHGGPVMTTRFSPDGKTLVTAGSDGLVRLWDAATRQEIDVLHAGWSEGDVPEPVLAIAYAPDRKLVASAHADKTVRLRDPSTGRIVHLFEENDNLVSSIAFSPDGRLLATAGSDKIVKLRDVDAGRESKSKSLIGHTDEVLSLAFAPDGTRLASGGADKTVRLWDVVTGDQQAKLKGHSAAVRSVAFSADGKRLASAGDDGAVKIWDPEKSQPRATLAGHDGGTRAVAFSPDGETLATAGEDKSIKLWDIKSGKPRSTLVGHAAEVRCLAFSPQGGTLASGGLDNKIRLWDPATGRHRATLRGHDDAITSLTFAPGTGALITGSRDTTIKVWNSQPPQFSPIATLEVTAEGASCLFGAISPDGQVMITAGKDKAISVWDMETGRFLRSDEYPGGTPICGSLSPDGRLLATGTYGATVHLWDVAAGRRVAQLATDGTKIRAVDFSPDAKRLAISSGQGTMSVWDVQTREKLWTLPGQALPMTAVVFSPDGKALATTTLDQTAPLKLWDVENGKELAAFSADASGQTHARFSPDGKLLVACGVDQALRIWEVESRELRSTIQMSKSSTCLAILPGGKWILTGHYGPLVSVWDIDSGRLAAEYVDDGGRTSVHALWSSPDGSLIAATGAKGVVTFWPTLPDESTAGETSAKRVREWSAKEPGEKETLATLEQELP